MPSTDQRKRRLDRKNSSPEPRSIQNAICTSLLILFLNFPGVRNRSRMTEYLVRNQIGLVAYLMRHNLRFQCHISALLPRPFLLLRLHVNRSASVSSCLVRPQAPQIFPGDADTPGDRPDDDIFVEFRLELRLYCSHQCLSHSELRFIEPEAFCLSRR